MNLAQLLSETASRHPDKPAIVFEGTSHSYRAFDRQVERYSAMLRAEGVGKGDRVAIQLPKRMEFLFLHFAILSVGAITLPLNVDYRAGEVEYFLSDSGSSLFVTDGERFLRAADAIRGLRGIRTLLVDGAVMEGAGSLPDRLARAPATFQRGYPADGDDVSMICYTSGTTGRSKGAMITHRNLVSNMLALSEAWEWKKEDVLLHLHPRLRAPFPQPLSPVREGDRIPDPGALRHDRDGDEHVQPHRSGPPERGQRRLSAAGRENSGRRNRRQRRPSGGRGGGVGPGGQRVPGVLGDAR